MKLLYIAFARMPTEKAHGFTIAKSCESFARIGVDVTLIVPKRKTQIEGDVFSVYNLERNFRILEVAVPDLIGRFGDSRVAFWLHYVSFYFAVKARLLFETRSTIIYTREVLYSLYALWGFTVVFESHLIPKHRTPYFLLAKRASRIIVISKALRNSFIAAGFEEAGLLVAPSGVDLSVFDIDVSKEAARKKLQLPLDTKIAVYTGNFTTMGEDKGITDIIGAFKNIPDILFVGIGGSDKDMIWYEAKAKEFGVADRVKLLGYVPQAKLALYEKAADVLLMPFPDTPHYRSHMSPVKMFEYMASGTPIIASDLPTIREVLDDSNAYLIPPGKTDMLAKTIVDVCGHPAKAVARAAKAYADVVSYAWEARSHRILSYIRALGV